MIDKGDGYKLSESYDLIPSELIANQKELALTLNDKNTNITRNDFIKFGLYCELNINLVNLLINKMLSYKDKWIKEINNSELSVLDKTNYINLINKKVDV